MSEYGRLHTPRFHWDDRRTGWFSVFDTDLIKDYNISKIHNRDTLVAWHRHERQSDFWFVPEGLLQVGLAASSSQFEWIFLGPERNQVLEIPPGIWHGYKAVKDNTILVYGLTNKYNGTDEERCSVDDMGINWFLGAR
jgi:dTDP-4-dehydrorhamnose 3,5-epimerase-like enzyme